MFDRWRAMYREEGAALIELAFVLGALGPVLLLGTVQISGWIYASIEATNAAHAGAAYAAENYISFGTLPTPSQVTTAVENDSPDLMKLLAAGTSPTISMATGCNGSAATTGNTVPSCASGVLPYVQVTIQASVAPLVSLPALGTSNTMSSTAIVNLVN